MKLLSFLLLTCIAFAVELEPGKASNRTFSANCDEVSFAAISYLNSRNIEVKPNHDCAATTVKCFSVDSEKQIKTVSGFAASARKYGDVPVPRHEGTTFYHESAIKGITGGYLKLTQDGSQCRAELSHNHYGAWGTMLMTVVPVEKDWFEFRSNGKLEGEYLAAIDKRLAKRKK